MSDKDIAGITQQFSEHTKWGFISRFGRTGRTTSLNTEDGAKTVDIKTPHGSMTAKVGRDTAIYNPKADGSREDLTFEDLTVGMLITVDGEKGTRENAFAADILIMPEGDGGFNIQPASKSGPSMVRIPVVHLHSWWCMVC